MVTYGKFKYTKIFKDARDFYLYVYYPKSWTSNGAAGGGYNYLTLSNGTTSGIDKIISLWMEKSTLSSWGLSNPDNTIEIPNSARVFYRTQSMIDSSSYPIEIYGQSDISYNIFCSGGDYNTIVELFIIDDVETLGSENESATTETNPNDIINNISFDTEGNVTSVTIDATDGTVTISDEGKVITSNGITIYDISSSTSNGEDSPEEETIDVVDTTATTTSDTTETNEIQTLVDKIKSDSRGKHILVVVIVMIIIYILYKNRDIFIPDMDMITPIE